MKRLFLLFCILLAGSSCLALDVVYPKKTVVTISASSTFFVGSTNPAMPLRINGESVKVHKSGGFAHPVNLVTGKNIFNLESGQEKTVYIIDRPMPKPRVDIAPFKFVDYEPKPMLISKDGAPLRKTPVDSGINRMSHFQKNIPLIVNGEDKEFYRVLLNDNTHAWVYKGDVSKVDEDFSDSPATLKKFKQKDTDEFYIFTFEFDKKTPYVIDEKDPFLLSFYNVADNPDNTYVFEFPHNQRLIGYSGEFEGNRFVLKIRKPYQITTQCPLAGIRIAVDPGHGGNECGAVGCFGDLEKDINLAISKYLEEELTSRGAEVIMTRTADVYLGLKERIVIANEKNASMLLSIHANALPDNLDPNKYRGTSVYYYYDQSKPLADSILNSMVTKSGTQNDRVRQGSLALVRNTNALSVLIEVAYMINPYDNEMLLDREFQKRCARAIADGIEDYLKLDNKKEPQKK